MLIYVYAHFYSLFLDLWYILTIHRNKYLIICEILLVNYLKTLDCLLFKKIGK